MASVSAQKILGHTCIWPLYEFASTGFSTTILVLVFPIYYQRIISEGIYSPARATYYWSLSLITALVLSAVLSIVIGVASDLVRKKKRTLMLVMTAGGALSSGMLMIVGRGQVLFASILFIISYICYLCSSMLYESLLCHLPPQKDRHEASARGLGMNYLGGLILSVLNLALLYADPGPQGYRAALLISSLWWAIMSVPFFWMMRTLEQDREEREMHTRPAVRVILDRFSGLYREFSREREVSKFVVAYLALFVGISTLTGFGPIYGAELGLRTTDLIFAILLAQTAGVPFTFIIGKLAGESGSVRAVLLSVIVLNAMLVPAIGTLLPVTKSFLAGTIHDPGAATAGLADISAVPSPGAAELAVHAGRFLDLHPFAGFALLISLLEALVLAVSLTVGRTLFSGIIEKIDLRATILLCLFVYTVCSVWGSIISTTMEFWLLCFMISLVHGGCQALSRSAYSFMVPKSRSGELFGVLNATKTIATAFGPVLLALSATLFSSSRPGMFSLAFLFMISASILVRTVIADRTAMPVS